MPIFDDIRVPKLETHHELVLQDFQALEEDVMGVQFYIDDLDKWRKSNYRREEAYIQKTRLQIHKMTLAFKQLKKPQSWKKVCTLILVYFVLYNK